MSLPPFYWEYLAMHVTLWGEYGIHCCTVLAGHYPQQVAASTIAEALMIEVAYTHQILQRLRQGGIVESSRGARGGYFLTRPPEEISLLDVFVATEGDTFRLVCDSKPIQDSCGLAGRCGLQAVWSELRGAIDTVLESHTIASLRGRTPINDDGIVSIQSLNRGSSETKIDRSIKGREEEGSGA
jgi:Rrf2 family protein